MPRVDIVTFNDTEYRRYPDSEHRVARNYYKASGDPEADYLHRDKWRHHHGEIPEGHHIHHIDGDPTNNAIENLECLAPEEHVERHPDIGGLQSDDHHAKMLEKAAEWHSSEEGRAWHREHFEEALGDAYEPITKECEECGDEFEDRTSNKNKRFCTLECKQASQIYRGGEARTCPACRQTFHRPPSYPARCCSTACDGALRAWENRVG